MGNICLIWMEIFIYDIVIEYIIWYYLEVYSFVFYFMKNIEWIC